MIPHLDVKICCLCLRFFRPGLVSQPRLAWGSRSSPCLFYKKLQDYRITENFVSGRNNLITVTKLIPFNTETTLQWTFPHSSTNSHLEGMQSHSFQKDYRCKPQFIAFKTLTFVKNSTIDSTKVPTHVQEAPETPGKDGPIGFQ